MCFFLHTCIIFHQSKGNNREITGVKFTYSTFYQLFWAIIETNIYILISFHYERWNDAAFTIGINNQLHLTESARFFIFDFIFV